MKQLLFLLCLVLLWHGTASGATEEAKEPIYYPLDPPFVVNLNSGQRIHFMQVKAQVMTYSQDVVKAIQEHNPAVRDAMIMLLAHQDARHMRSLDGREAVRQQALQALNEVLSKQAGKPGVEAVYITDFVIQ